MVFLGKNRMPTRRFANYPVPHLHRAPPRGRPASSRSGNRASVPFFTAIILFLFLFLAAAPPLPAAHGGPAGEKRKTISFGVIPRFNPHVIYEYYQPLMDYLTRNTPYDFRLRLGRTYTETMENLEKGVTDVAYLGGTTFALARQRFGARALVKPRNPEGGSTYRSCIVVREDSPIKTLEDLKGKSLALGAKRSTTGSLIPSYLLVEAGIAMNALKELKHFPHHEYVAGAVLKGTCDAGAVKDVVARNYNGKGLRVIAASEELPNAPIAAGPSLPKEAEEALVRALLAIDAESPEGRALFADWGPELRHGFVPATDEDYAFLYRRIMSIPTGCGKGCHASNPFLRR
jgi:phosphonate transport system substrate-binding protein